MRLTFTASGDTVALSVVRNKVGNARFTHDGPPGAVVIKANQANFEVR